MKNFSFLLILMLLILFFSNASALTMNQTVEESGTIFVEGNILPIYRITLSMAELSGNKISIELSENMQNDFRFLDCKNDKMVDKKEEDDQKLLNEYGEIFNTVVAVSDSSITIFPISNVICSTFTCYIVPKSREKLDTLITSGGEVTSTISVNGVTSIQTFFVHKPKLVLELLTDSSSLTDGSLDQLSYKLTFNENKEVINENQPIAISCSFANQYIDVDSVTLPTEAGWTMAGDDVLFSVPDQTAVIITFDAFPSFNDANPGVTSSGVVRTIINTAGYSDIIRRDIKYRQPENGSEYIDILIVNADNYSQGIKGAAFEIKNMETTASSPVSEVIETDENGYARLLGPLDQLNTPSWHLSMDETYVLSEVRTPEGYLPLSDSLQFTMANERDTSTGKYRPGQLLLISYKPGVHSVIGGTYMLSGRDMRADESREFTLSAYNDLAKNTSHVKMPQNLKATVSQSSTSMQFYFEPVTFMAPGTYVFEIGQENLSAVGIEHDVEQILVSVTIISNSETGGLSVSEMKTVNITADMQTETTELSVRDRYTPASAYYIIRGTIYLDGTKQDTNQFYAVLMRDGAEIDRAVCGQDGSFEFRQILFTKEMAGTSYDFEVVPGELTKSQVENGIVLQSQVSAVKLTAVDNGQGSIVVTESGNTPVEIEYEHIRKLHIVYRMHQSPPSMAEAVQTIQIKVNTSMEIPLECMLNGVNTQVTGKKLGNDTVYECSVKNGTELTISNIPVGTTFSINFPETADGAQAGFSYLGQTYLTQNMSGCIGGCFPEYEALMIYPFGTYVPSLTVKSLYDMDMDSLTFGMRPADGTTAAAFSAGWICFSDDSEILSGSTNEMNDTEAEICFLNGAGEKQGIEFYREGTYSFEVVPLNVNDEAVGFQNNRILVELNVVLCQTDMLKVEEKNTFEQMICYPKISLQISVRDTSFTDAHNILLSMQHSDIELGGQSLKVVQNGEESACVLSGGQSTVQAMSGDVFTWYLPYGTTFSAEVPEDDLTTELVPTELSDLYSGSLITATELGYVTMRKNASIRLDVHQYMEKTTQGQLRICFFESDEEEDSEPVTGLSYNTVVNGTSVELVQDLLTVYDGDAVSISGRLCGLKCEIESVEPENAIVRFSLDEKPYIEKKTAEICLEAGRERQVSVTQSMVNICFTGTVEVLGEALAADCFEIVIQQMDGETVSAVESIQCPASSDGRFVFTANALHLSKLGEYHFVISEKPKKPMPIIIIDKSVYHVRYTIEACEDGSVSVEETLSKENNSKSEKRVDNGIVFTNVKMSPVQIVEQTIDKDVSMSFEITISNSGSVTKHPYTVGTKNGQLQSGDSMTLLNEQAVIWLPYGAHYQIRAVPLSGFIIMLGEGESLNGIVGENEQTIHITAKYEPETMLTSGKTSLSGQIIFENGQWTSEVFTLSLYPADDETLAAMGKGFRFTDEKDALTFSVTKENSDFEIAVVESDSCAGKGIRVLQAGRYIFRLKQVDTNLSDICLDDHEETLILDITDDENGHIIPKLYLADENDTGIIFKNFALANLTVSCSVRGKTTDMKRAYEKQKLLFELSVPAMQDKMVTVTLHHGKKTETRELTMSDGKVSFELSHAETVLLPGLPAGTAYSVKCEQIQGYTADRQEMSGTLEYGQNTKADFTFKFCPSVETVIEGRFQLLSRKPYPQEFVKFELKPADQNSIRMFGDEYQLIASIALNRTTPESGIRTKTSLRAAAPTDSYVFSFDPLHFEETGTYVFDLRQESERMADTQYDDRQYQVKIKVTDPEPGSGRLKAQSQILLNGKPAELFFANTYDAHGEVVFTGRVMPFERSLVPGEFEFELLEENGNVLGHCKNQENGEFRFDAIQYNASDIGHVLYYRIHQIKGNAGGVEYDGCEYRAVVAIRDAGEGVLTVNTAYSKRDEGEAWRKTDGIRFENRYRAVGETTVEGDLLISGRPFLLGEVFSAHLLQKNDTDEWLEIESVSLNPNGEKQLQFSFDALQFTLSDVQDSPIQYRLTVEGSFTQLLQLDGLAQRDFQIELMDLGDGTLAATSSLSETNSVFSLMAYTEQTIICKFDDNDNINGIRPEAFFVRVLANGKEVDQLELNAENNWQTTTGLMPMSDQNGKNILYKLKAVQARPYGLTLSGDEITGYLLTARYRSHYGSTNSDELVKRLAPDTGDGLRIELYIGILMILSAILIVFYMHEKR